MIKEGLAVEAQDAEENFGGSQGEDHSDSGVEKPVGNAGVRFFGWGSWCFQKMISREHTS